MRALLVHARKFEARIIAKSNRPRGISPEARKSSSEKMRNCIVAFFCVEQGDTGAEINQLYDEIVKIAGEISCCNIMIAPFVHLSNNIAEPLVSKKLSLKLIKKFRKTKYKVKASYYGYHKELLLEAFGHPGSFKYREFSTTTHL